ncbi:MAG: dienelactone hydrolase family protein [Chloroflexi bacterium]|nr:dienelactone hydrolase family protein [Chloroflexota bacterium]
MAYQGLIAETVNINGHNGDQIDAYLARPLGSGPVPGVVLIHHMPGWDDASKAMATKLAYHGYATISPNLHFREGKATPQENSASVAAAGGMPDDRTMADVAAAISYLRSLPYHNGKVGIIGFCSGGRQVYLAAGTLSGINAAVDCWGGGVTASADQLTDRQPVAPIDFTSGITCALLGLFGQDDARPSPADVAKTEEELKKHNKNYEFYMYEGAGHGFFAVDRPSYRQHAAVDGWEKVLAFYDKHLRDGGGSNGQQAGQTMERIAVPA